jgi:protoporphyrinogen oxidase
MILVLGGGVTGLAAGTALAAAGENFLVLEREAEPGGWCRSIVARKYVFDMSGHFLHVSSPDMREWILGVPGVPWREVERDARVLLDGVLTPYPFQVHLKGRPAAFVSRCLADFAAERIRAAVHGERPPEHFAGWLMQRFGKSMCEAFFFPYNRKMWRTPLTKLGYEWTGWSVPVPRFDDLLAGTSGEIRQGMGYNARFFYPARGGIGALASALARPLKARLRPGTEVTRIDLPRKVVHTAGGDAIPYRSVISTIPLPMLAARSAGLGRAAREAAKRLSWVKVLSINLGVRMPGRTPGHWVYVPEHTYPFFRVGFLSNVVRSSAPAGCASIFVEKSFPAGAPVNVSREIEAAVRGLKRIGVLRRGSRIDELRPVMLDPAYVLFDGSRGNAVRLLTREFRRSHIFPAGRYGAWDYYGMETSMSDGLRAAREAARPQRR